MRYPESPVLVFVRAEQSWSRTYARQPEILAYLESVADDFDLRRHLRSVPRSRSIALECGHLALGLPAGPRRAHRTDRRRRGQRCRPVRGAEAARYRGLERLRRPGDAHRAVGRTIALAGKKVAVIGTGASGVQVVPELAEVAERVTVFQRTPPWMVPKDDRAFQRSGIGAIPAQPAGGAAARAGRSGSSTRQHRDVADDPLVAGRRQVATSFLERTVADERLRAR